MSDPSSRRQTMASAGWSAFLVGCVWWSTLIEPGESDLPTVHGPTALEVAALAVASIGLLLRHRAPALGLVLVGGAEVASVIWELPGGGYHYAGLFAVFFVALRFPTRQALLVVVPVMGAVLVAEIAMLDWRWYTFAPMWVVLSTALALALGQVRMLREQLVASLNQRAEEAEATRETLVRVHVAEARLGTARDVHDAVAHRIAVIHLRAAVALRTDRSATAVSREALQEIDAAATTALAEIDQLLADLRADDADHPTAANLDLDEIVEEFARHGLKIDVAHSGDLEMPATAIADVARRGVVEGLTNALKHGGDGVAQLTVEVADQRLAVTVCNAVGPHRDATREGWGLQGLRERAEALGGMLRIDRTDGHFTLHFELPTERT